MDDNEIDLSDLQPITPVAPGPVKLLIRVRRCDNCGFSAKEGKDLVCRFNPPQVTFLLVPTQITVGTPNGPRMQQAVQPMNHTGFPIMRPDMWCGRFEAKKG